VKPADTAPASRTDCEAALYKLLQATLRIEALTSSRDSEFSKIQQNYAPRINRETEKVEALEAAIEAYYVSNRAELEANGQKSVQMAHGTLGMRTPANPALIPLNSKWTWDKITAAVLKTWKKRFVLPPRPAIDKVKLKKVLSQAELEACGLRLDGADKFYFELNRVTTPKEAA